VLLPTATAPPPGMPRLGPANPLAWWLLDRAMARAGRPLDDVLARAGSAQRGLPLFRARSPLLHVVACSPSIIRVAPDLPQGAVVTGAWIDRSPAEALPDALEAYLADGSPPVVVTFGSMRGLPPEELRAAVDRLLASGLRVVAQGSLGDGAASRGLLPIGAVDHRALFGRAAIVVHHGGAGTTHAVAAAGVPSVVVPHVGDQRYWADRLLGLGVAARPLKLDGISADGLAEAVRVAVADPAMRDAAHALAARVSAEDGVGATIALLERFAA
ncbi:MAG: glycosyltransferase, partial [Candidatus Limnocylindria bacterium]